MRERPIAVGPVRSRVLEVDGAGPPLLLLHGFADAAESWAPLMRRLAGRGQRAVAIDLPGFGAAERLRPDRPILEQHVAFVRAACTELFGDEPPVIAGNSLGGTVSLLTAEARPSPAAVVPIAPAGFEVSRWLGTIMQQPLMRMLMNDATPVPEAVVRQMLVQSVRQVAFAHPLRARHRSLAHFGRFHPNRRSVRRLMHSGNRLVAEMQDPFDVARIDCPILLVWGDLDRLVPVEASKVLRDAHPALRYVELDGVGHCPQLETPDLVLEPLLELCLDVADAAAKSRRAPLVDA